jgi:uncharacterized protein YbjT (DUF2867 family)
MATDPQTENKTVLITGATGYIGGQLVPRLLKQGRRIKVLVRDPSGLQDQPWANQVEVTMGDALEPASVAAALEGVHTAYYLIHSMMSGEDFHQRDLRAAETFGHAAHRARVKRIIYLGGLGDPETELSIHLRSRQETGEVLRSSGVQVIELRAGVVVGAGSASFEMIRYLTERVPIMICPRWVFTKIQPISIGNLLDYLAATLMLEASENLILEIGGPDVISYGDMLRGYARARGLRRWIIPVPVLTPRLSSYWVHWVTPIPAAIARPLIEGLRNEVIVQNDDARKFFPELKLERYEDAVRSALEPPEPGIRLRILRDPDHGEEIKKTITHHQGMIVETFMVESVASPDQFYAAFTRLGGRHGWLYANWAWKTREIIDAMVGGVGGRRNPDEPTELRINDTIGSWRVDHIQVGHALRLRSEMRLPGEAWIQFTASDRQPEGSIFTQRSIFRPKGLIGFLYWKMLYPIHRTVFSGLAQALADNAERQTDYENTSAGNLS